MTYQEFVQKKELKELVNKAFALFDLGFYEADEVETLPDLVVIEDDKKLIVVKINEKLALYEELTENEVTYGYKIYYLENLTDDQYAEVTKTVNKTRTNFFSKVIIITGLVFFVVTFVLFWFVFLTVIGNGTAELAFSIAAPYFNAFLLALILVAIGLLLKCKDSSSAK